MSRKKSLRIIGIGVMLLFVIGCNIIPQNPADDTTPETAAATDVPEAPAATDTPEPSEPGATLETATALCDNAFSEYNPDVPLISGAVVSPVFTLKALAKEEDRLGEGPWKWSPHPVVDTVEASSPEAAKAMVCIMEMRKKVGTYDNGGIAYRPSWTVLLVQWPNGNVCGRDSFLGEDPPEAIPASQKIGVGDEPTKDFSDWLFSVTDEEKILHPGAVASVAFSPDGQTLAVGGAFGAVHLWDLSKEEEAGPLLAEGAMVSDVTYSPDGQVIAAAGYEAIRFWEVATRKEMSIPEGIEEGRFVAYSPDGKTLAAGAKKTIYILDADTGEEISVLTADKRYYYEVAFSPDGKILAARQEEVVEIWDLEAGELKGTLGLKDKDVADIAISPDGKTIALGFRSGEVRQWNLATGKLQATENEIKSRRLAIFSIAYSPDGKYLATGQANTAVGLWDAATGKLIRTYEAHSDAVNSVDFSPDGTKLASGSRDGTVMIWDLE